jgi:hypothetical protein
MKDFVQDFVNNSKNYHIYVHNLGNFDGYLLIKYFYEFLGKYDILMDKSKTIINIDLPNNISIRDSLRIFPSSLDELSKQFKVENPKISFNHNQVTVNKIYNDKKFKKNLEQYLTNDLIYLLQVILATTKMIYENYGVDLSKTYSTASLAIKIFRTKFLDKAIPLLPKHVDTFVRNSYRGGATDVYRCVGENLHYYDVNYLYPYAMKKPMPYKFLGIVNKPELNNFFEFVYAKIRVPLSVKTPVLPWQDINNKTLIYPHGTFTGHFLVKS